MNKIALVLTSALISGTCAGAEQLSMIVGTYTNAGSVGIYSYSFNQDSGDFKLLDEFAVNNPSYLTLSKDGKHIYAVSENTGDNAIVSTFNLDATSGKMTKINSQPALDDGPCYISATEKAVFTANYDKGSIAAFPINKDGSISSASYFERFTDTGILSDRQATSHLHCVQPTLDNKYLFATNLGGDCIYSYEIAKNGTALNKKSALKIDLAKGSGPRHLTFSPNGKFAYLITEISGEVMVFDHKKGKLKLLQTILTNSAEKKGNADIHISPDGKYLYASNRTMDDGITIFKISDNGLLEDVGYQFTGIHPRNFSITPNGKYVLVACRDSNIIEIYERDAESGLLTKADKGIELSKPVCIKFSK